MANNRQLLILDSIIFDLQRAGGISRYWLNLVLGLAQQRSAEPVHLSIDRQTENPFGRTLLGKVEDIPAVIVHQRRENRLTRYFPPRLWAFPAGGLFHSSYYRFGPAKRANVVTVHDFTYEKYIGGLPAMVHKWQKSRALFHSAQIICISESTRRDLLEHHPQLDPSRTHVIHHGIEAVFHGHQAMPHVIPDPYVIFVGERYQYKNFRSVALALATLPGLKLVAVGKPFSTEEREWLSGVIPGRFEVRSKVSDEDLAFLYRNAFALAYPSSYEGFGMPVIEAMACGCPVVALNASSIPEIAGNAALLLREASAESISSALNEFRNIAYREEMIASGLLRAQQFTWNSAVEQHLAVYELALSRPL